MHGKRNGQRRQWRSLDIQRSVETIVETSFSLSNETNSARRQILEELAQQQSQPSLSTKTNAYRSNFNGENKQAFRAELLGKLQVHWKDPRTLTGFLGLVEKLDRDGCTVFAGLIENQAFDRLIYAFTGLMQSSGSHSFLHSFVNLAENPDFVTNPDFKDAYVHPLMIAMISYVMGGPIRMADARGKDTDAISVRAQDNMLHVDNTPFREEYKILVAWEKGTSKGPSGQNFTFLPGTNKGTRNIRIDADGTPWSTENDSIFVTSASVQNVLNFQSAITGCEPLVAEVSHSDRPVSVVFNASALVHHRYRTYDTSARSCIIAAFHLVSDNPGALVASRKIFQESDVTDHLIGVFDKTDSDWFIDALLYESTEIEAKVLEISYDSGGTSLIDNKEFRLVGEAFARWKATCSASPSTTSIRMREGVLLSCNDPNMSMALICQRVAKVMSFDKHGLLDLILYRDGHEEIRKNARKCVWSMEIPMILKKIRPWLLRLREYSFNLADIMKPMNLRKQTDEIALTVQSQLLRRQVKRLSTISKTAKFWSFYQLLVDLGESVVRCDETETYISTTLFIFWTLNHLLPVLELSSRRRAVLVTMRVLKSYLASVLLVESFRDAT